MFFLGSDAIVNITAHVTKYTPKGTLHSNHQVSLSKGFEKCNITQRGLGLPLRDVICHRAAGIICCCVLQKVFRPINHLFLLLGL